MENATWGSILKPRSAPRALKFIFAYAVFALVLGAATRWQLNSEGGNYGPAMIFVFGPLEAIPLGLVVYMVNRGWTPPRDHP